MDMYRYLVVTEWSCQFSVQPPGVAVALVQQAWDEKKEDQLKIVQRKFILEADALAEGTVSVSAFWWSWYFNILWFKSCFCRQLAFLW